MKAKGIALRCPVCGTRCSHPKAAVGRSCAAANGAPGVGVQRGEGGDVVSPVLPYGCGREQSAGGRRPTRNAEWIYFSPSPPPPLGLEHLFCKSCSFQPVFIASPVSFTEQWPQAPPEEGESAVPSAAMVPRLLGLCCPISGFYSAHHREFGVSWRSFCSPPSDKAHLKWSAGALLYAKSKLRW